MSFMKTYLMRLVLHADNTVYSFKFFVVNVFFLVDFVCLFQ